MNRNSFSPKSAQSGVALIEAMVAILLFSIGVLAVAGLQASMVRNTGDTKYRADASYIAQSMLGQMYSDLGGTSLGIYNVETLVTSLPGGKMSVNQAVLNGPYTIVVGWTAPGDEVTAATAATCQPLNNVAHCYKVSASVVPDCYPGDPGC